MSIDLHCHTVFSVDSYGTPEALVDLAADRGLTALAVTEHNHLGSTARAAARAAERGVRFFTGIQLDAFVGDRSHHFLVFGIDPAHDALRRLAERNHAVYAWRFEHFYAQLLDLGFPVPREELEAQLPVRYPTHPSPALNHFLLRDYLPLREPVPDYEKMSAEATRRAVQAMRNDPDAARFCTFEQARDAIHAAGGICLLAHPGKVFPGNYDAQAAFIRARMGEGMDGFELYHYANASESRFEELAALALELDCPVSGGSDCGHLTRPTATELGGCGAPDELADRLAEAIARGASARAD